MRQLGTIRDEGAAQRFADYLLTRGIAVSLEPEPDGCRMWVRNEDHLEPARQEFAQFNASPDAPIYQQAGRLAEEMRAEERRRVQQARKNLVKVSANWRSGMARRTPVTFLLMAVSIGLTFFSNYGKDNSIVAPLLIDKYLPLPYVLDPATGEYVPPTGPFPLARAWRAQPWRLITPIFLHLSIWHLVFNMMTLWQFALPIEAARGSWRFAILVLALGVASNLVQYFWNGPAFGGMSGVLYGLFGYLWMKSRYERSTEFHVSQSMVIWMIGWSVMCFMGILGPIANGAHVGGLIAGIILGRAPSLWRLLRRR